MVVQMFSIKLLAILNTRFEGGSRFFSEWTERWALVSAMSSGFRGGILVPGTSSEEPYRKPHLLVVHFRLPSFHGQFSEQRKGYKQATPVECKWCDHSILRGQRGTGLGVLGQAFGKT